MLKLLATLSSRFKRST